MEERKVLFGPDPIRPAWSPLRARHPGNLWMVNSPMLGREVFFRSDLERDNWILVESDPQVLWFCEYPIRTQIQVEGHTMTLLFHMAVKFKDGREVLQTVRLLKKSQPPAGSRSWLKISGFRRWCEFAGIEYELRTEQEIRRNPLFLANWKQIFGFLRTFSIDPELERRILAFVGQREECSLGTLAAMDAPRQQVWASTFRLIRCGMLQAPLATHRLGPDLPVQRGQDGKILLP